MSLCQHAGRVLGGAWAKRLSRAAPPLHPRKSMLACKELSMVDAGSQQGTHDNIEIGGCGGRRRQLGNLVGRPKQRMPAMGATNPDKFDVLGRGECGVTTLKLGGAGAQREPQRGRVLQPCKHGKSPVRSSEIWGSARAAPEQHQYQSRTRAAPEQHQSKTRAAPEQHQSSSSRAALGRSWCGSRWICYCSAILLGCFRDGSGAFFLKFFGSLHER